MIRHYIAICCALATLAPVQGRAQAQQSVESDQANAQNYLILTVPLHDPEVLDAIATGIEADFGVRLAAQWPLRTITAHCFVFDVSDIADIEALILAMRSDDRVRTVQRVQDFEFSATTYNLPIAYTPPASSEHGKRLLVIRSQERILTFLLPANLFPSSGHLPIVNETPVPPRAFH